MMAALPVRTEPIVREHFVGSSGRTTPEDPLFFFGFLRTEGSRNATAANLGRAGGRPWTRKSRVVAVGQDPHSVAPNRWIFRRESQMKKELETPAALVPRWAQTGTF